jgi:hypothetical protein
MSARQIKSRCPLNMEFLKKAWGEGRGDPADRGRCQPGPGAAADVTDMTAVRVPGLVEQR